VDASPILRRAITIAVAGVGVLLSLEVAAQETPALRLDDVLQTARERNPRLIAISAAAEAAAYRAPEASTLPDPTIQVGVMNFGVPDFSTRMAMSMAPAVQLMQMVPFPGKLGLRGEIADLSHEMALATADEAWWDLRGRASSMFFDLYALDRQIGVMNETLLLLQDFQEIARAMYSAGTGRQADVLRADVEVAKMDGDLRRMEAMRQSKAARLNALLDLPQGTPVASPILGDLPLQVPDQEELEVSARELRPALARGRLRVDQAESGAELAGRQIWPDFSVGLSYGQRNRGTGTERMASAMIGFSLPIHAGSRQYAMRDEAEAMERIAVADLQGSEADVNARIGELLAELQRARTLAVLYRDEVIPQARATTESALSSYRVGSVDFMTLVDAQMTVNRYEAELYRLFADYGAAISALESTIGRDLPRSGALLTEAR
jgi:outer membrane protein TolC